MATFGNFGDNPFQIVTEGQEITINFDRTGPNTGRISWNIPVPANGCGAENQAYDGIVVTIDTTHVSVLKNPTNGNVYVGDPTADANIHAGDTIDTALVIGAFYNDKETTYFDITGLQPNTPYYVSGYAVDAQHRYHIEGVHAYALDYKTNNKTPDTPGCQLVQLGTGVALTDSTSLIGGTLYDFTIEVDGNTPPSTIQIDGTDALTYADLINALSIELKQINGPQQSATVPGAGSYYWNAQSSELFQWDGYVHNALDAIVELTDPTIRAVGDFWYNPSTSILNRWDIPSVIGWNPTNVINYKKDPTILTCDDYWFSGTNAYNWSGDVWCERVLYNQIVDPTLPIEPDCGTFWFNDDTSILTQWNVDTNNWDIEEVIFWDVDPNTPAFNSFWFDDTESILYQWNGSMWVELLVTVSLTEPTSPTAGQYWFDTTLEELNQRDVGNTTWTVIPVLVWGTDPTIRSSCDIWWNSIDDNLYIWDVTTSLWDLVSTFIQSAVAPNATPIIPPEAVWYNPTDSTLSTWDGGAWVGVMFIEFTTDPMLPAINDTWFNTETSIWSVWTGSWTQFDPIDSENDPESTLIPTGTYWYDTSSDSLQQWNGTTWVVLLFTTTPLTPALGTLWCNTTSNLLYEWDGTTWSVIDPPVLVELNGDGHLLFTSTSPGSESSIIITDINLFGSLSPIGNILDPISGDDGVSDVPSYMEIGVGDDGTPDERRELIYSIRAQLGHPIVRVELTKYQLDTAVTAGIEMLRARSSSAYTRAYFFLDVNPHQQSYLLTNQTVGFNKIVSVTSIHRITSAFLSGAYAGGVYGQIALQQLYSLGTFDLLSYHLVASYVEELETLMGAKITYTWNEFTRKLDMMQIFNEKERVLVDASIERTEQELLTDRFTKTWIEQWALAESRIMLAEIRGKHATLPGAGGGVSLNAGELGARGDAAKLELLSQIDDFVVENIEQWGMGSTFVIG